MKKRSREEIDPLPQTRRRGEEGQVYEGSPLAWSSAWKLPVSRSLEEAQRQGWTRGPLYWEKKKFKTPDHAPRNKENQIMSEGIIQLNDPARIDGQFQNHGMTVVRGPRGGVFLYDPITHRKARAPWLHTWIGNSGGKGEIRNHETYKNMTVEERREFMKELRPVTLEAKEMASRDPGRFPLREEYESRQAVARQRGIIWSETPETALTEKRLLMQTARSHIRPIPPTPPTPQTPITPNWNFISSTPIPVTSDELFRGLEGFETPDRSLPDETELPDDSEGYDQQGYDYDPNEETQLDFDAEIARNTELFDEMSDRSF